MPPPMRWIGDAWSSIGGSHCSQLSPPDVTKHSIRTICITWSFQLQQIRKSLFIDYLPHGGQIWQCTRMPCLSYLNISRSSTTVREGTQHWTTFARLIMKDKGWNLALNIVYFLGKPQSLLTSWCIIEYIFMYEAHHIDDRRWSFRPVKEASGQSGQVHEVGCQRPAKTGPFGPI